MADTELAIRIARLERAFGHVLADIVRAADAGGYTPRLTERNIECAACGWLMERSDTGGFRAHLCARDPIDRERLIHVQAACAMDLSCWGFEEATIALGEVPTLLEYGRENTWADRVCDAIAAIWPETTFRAVDDLGCDAWRVFTKTHCWNNTGA